MKENQKHMDRTQNDIRKEMGELDILVAEQQAIQAEAGAKIAQINIKRAQLGAEFDSIVRKG